MLAYYYVPLLLCFDFILTDMDDTTGLPEQPSMPNADDSLSLSSMANSLPLGTCDTQSVMSSKRTSQFAEHDVSVYIRYDVPPTTIFGTTIAAVAALSSYLFFGSNCYYLSFSYGNALPLISPRMNATQLKKNITSRTVRPAHEVCIVTRVVICECMSCSPSFV